MATGERMRLAEVERRVCDIASEQLGIRRDRVSPGNRLVEDLRCDSLDLVELFIEEEQGEHRRDRRPPVGRGDGR
jgi:acyl carrier protein